MSVRKDTFINLAGYVVPMLVMVVTVPLYLRLLGDVRYGVLALVWLVLGYFSFLEMGLGKATANHLARLRDAPPEERGVVFWTAIAVNGALGLGGALVLWIIGSFLLSHTVKIPAEFRTETLAALPWMIATLPLAMVSSVLTGALEGRRRFLAVNVLQVFTTVVFQIVPLLVAYARGPSLALVIPAAVLSRALMNGFFLRACYRYVPLTLRPQFSRAVAKSLLSFGGWIAVTSIAGAVMETADRLLVGAVMGPRAMTHYTIPFQLAAKVKVIPGSLGRALFPRFSADHAPDADRLASSSLLSLLAIMTPTVLCAVVLLHPFMTIWVGDPVATAASPLGEIMLVGIWANSVAHIPYFLLQGKGLPWLVARLQLVESVPFLLALWAALHYWGLPGAALTWTLRTVVDAAILFRISRMPSRCFRAMLVPGALVVGAVVGIHWLGAESLRWRVAVAIFLLVAVSLWMASAVGKELFGRLVAMRAPPTSAETRSE